MSEPVTLEQIDIRARYFYLSCLLVFGIRFVSNTLFSQLSQPILIGPGIDNTYWLFHWLGIPHRATHSILWSAVLDILLFLVPVVASLRAGRRYFALLFSMLVLVYQITYSTYAIHHYHSLLGVLFLSIPFWFVGQRFSFLWDAARYYFFFIFASAAIWKLSTGSLWAPGQMSSILMAQHAQTIYENPSSIFSQLHSYLIAHTGIAQVFLWAGFLIQLSFLGGFFTRKYDRIYLALFIAFFVINYLLMQIVSLDLFIYCLVLLDWNKIERKSVNTSVS